MTENKIKELTLALAVCNGTRKKEDFYFPYREYLIFTAVNEYNKEVYRYVNNKVSRSFRK